MVWRSISDPYCNMSLGDSPSDLDSEAFDRTSTIITDDFHTFKVLLNTEQSYSQASRRCLCLWHQSRIPGFRGKMC